VRRPEQLEDFSKNQQKVLKSLRTSRIILPILIGVGVVLYLLWRQFDPQEFRKIQWTSYALFWIGVALLILVIRHLAYAYRLRLLSEGVFGWRKCIELIFIWEFSSAVSPTSLGGSAVAFFVLAQEKLSAAKTATIVLYTIVLDTLFFLITLPLLYFLFGTGMIRPNLDGVTDLDAWGYYFLLGFFLMLIYGTLFYYGLFKNPLQLKRVLVGFTKIRFFRKYRRKAIDLGNEIMVASGQLKRQNWKFHSLAFLATVVAWLFRFLSLNCLIIGLLRSVPTDFWSQFEVYGRFESMFIILAFSPTPGGAGIIELLFNNFFNDYVTSATNATVIATLWRVLTFYSYLLAGVIIIPNWLRKVIEELRKKRLQKK